MLGRTITGFCTERNMGNNKQLVFQIVLIAVFSIVAAIGVFVLARGGGFGKTVVPTTPVVIWGPRFTGANVQAVLSKLGEADPRLEKVTYVEKHPMTLYGDTLEAIATGKAPDMVIVDQSSLLPLKNKLVPIPYDLYPVSDYRRDFVEISEVFLQDEGVYALPFAVDPLVLFWNRDLFTNSTIAQVPENWDTFVRLAPRLTVITDGADLRQGAIAFGEYDNVMHAKEILSALLFQLDNPIVERVNGKYRSTLITQAEGAYSPIKALTFYTDFANPNKLVYSWNKKFAPSREAFATNKVAMYAGFASEVPTLTQTNPNLNFGLTLWPQSTVGKKQVTYGKVYGVALLATSPNKDRAFSVMRVLSERTGVDLWKEATLLPSVRRDKLTEAPSDDPYASTLIRSAIMARTWLEPAGGAGRGVSDVFEALVNTVVANKESAATAMSEAHRDLETMYEEYNER